jgi:NTP pyrophosphatase (non-canonical NTP hydrolase)
VVTTFSNFSNTGYRPAQRNKETKRKSSILGRRTRLTIQEYQELAMRTKNTELTRDQQLIDGVLGLCGESGEVSDMLKKHLFQGHDFKKEDLINELGDVMWYIALICESQHLSLNGVMVRNIDKLEKRYPKGFSEEASINRLV